MKQLFSILLLGIFAFNIFGYRIYFDIAEKNSTAIAENKIEKEEYAAADLISYKFSAKQLPYYTNSKYYEVANGEVDVNGTIMTYIKKRIYKDSIEYVCLPNQTKTNLRTAREDFFKLVNDLQSSTKNSTQKKQTSTNPKPFSFDAVAFETIQTRQVNFSTAKNMYSFYQKDILPNPYYHLLTPPPNYFI